MRTKDVRALLETARRTGQMPTVAEKDMPDVRREARRMGIRISADAVVRSTNDCLRMAITHAYGVPYDDTPDLDPLTAPPGAQQATWEAWAAERGLRWWSSNELAPAGASRWIACVPSKVVAGAVHAVVMEADRLLFDPMEGGDNAWTEVRQEDVREARMLLSVDSPIWDEEISYWPIGS